jgi:hypothetical protein
MMTEPRFFWVMAVIFVVSIGVVVLIATGAGS